jgi:Cu(I)/Ag(I) efflux system membrane fusion protein
MGYVSADDPAEAPLVIPVSAPLITGRRAVVYVELPGTDQPTFEGREVVLGPRAGDFYLVESGLVAGEQVVVNGNFKIDSALQIHGKPSMMSPEEPAHSPHRHPIPDALREPLGELFASYFSLGAALTENDLGRASDEFAAVRSAATRVPAPIEGGLHTLIQSIAETAGAAAEAPDLGQARHAFRDLSGSFLELEGTVGHPGDATHFEVFCPMAFGNEGASWLQDSRRVTNPYYGPAMLRCGEIRATFTPAEAHEPGGGKR